MPGTPKEECEEVMNFLLPFVKKLLTEQGEFFPVGAAMQVDGAIAAVATFDGDDHPASQTVIDSLLDVFRAGAKQRKADGLQVQVQFVRTDPRGHAFVWRGRAPDVLLDPRRRARPSLFSRVR
jgi:hypothetical protein